MRSDPYATPNPAMVQAVNEMFQHLENLCTDPSLIGSCPEMPGILLEKVLLTPLDRESAEYKAITREYNALREDYLKALVAHPVGRSLALLSVGPDGVQMMEQGRAPSPITDVRAQAGKPIQGRRDAFYCHHVIPKSTRPKDLNSVAINHPNNFVMTKTVRRGRDQSQNPHHLWHALILHPQLHRAPDHPISVYVVRPLFPFYPPLSKGFRSAEQLRETLKRYGAPELPEIWEKRLLEFSNVTNHKPYAVPKEYHELTQSFGDLYQKRNKDPAVNDQLRANLCAKAASFAAEFLPAGAYVNGKRLPPDHKPKVELPTVEPPKDVQPFGKLPVKRSRTTKKGIPANSPQPSTQIKI
ncbi:MAG: hypothetical protein JO076_10685 [Verrucomicrobia bacterium]|nr:hypothetical protein [Verrucomicrobiota bacterium]